MRAFTLLEIMVVLIIIGILAVLSMANYSKTIKGAYDKEAQSALSLIRDAEKIYRLRGAAYYPSSLTEGNINNINVNLKLNLVEQRWDYSITGGAATFTATATRNGKTWSIDQDDPEAVCTAGC